MERLSRAAGQEGVAALAAWDLPARVEIVRFDPVEYSEHNLCVKSLLDALKGSTTGRRDRRLLYSLGAIRDDNNSNLATFSLKQVLVDSPAKAGTRGPYLIDSARDSGASAWEILKLAEFRAVVAPSGRIGYLKHPVIGLRKLSDRLRDLVRKPAVKPFTKLASTAADAAGAAGLAGAAGEALGLAPDGSGERFHPPFKDEGADQC